MCTAVLDESHAAVSLDLTSLVVGGTKRKHPLFGRAACSWLYTFPVKAARVSLMSPSHSLFRQASGFRSVSVGSFPNPKIHTVAFKAVTRPSEIQAKFVAFSHRNTP